MKERPILFSGEMVRAILAGNKSQTRRVIQFPRKWIGIVDNDLMESGFWNTGECWQYGDDRLPQNYQVGDRLWVRETWAIYESGLPAYRADGDDGLGWRPSIFMSKDIARIWLEITGVKVERLKDISGQDAIMEGVELIDKENRKWKCYGTCEEHERGYLFRSSATASFMSLWDSINAKRGYPWNSNPWIWMIGFRGTEP